MLLIFRFLLTFIVVMLIAHNMPGIAIDNYTDACFFAIILSAVNSVVRPILLLLTLPVTIITLGLSSLFINVFTFWLATEISYGIHILSFQGAFFGGLIMWITGLLSNRFIWNTNLY